MILLFNRSNRLQAFLKKDVEARIQNKAFEYFFSTFCDIAERLKGLKNLNFLRLYLLSLFLEYNKHTHSKYE